MYVRLWIFILLKPPPTAGNCAAKFNLASIRRLRSLWLLFQLKRHELFQTPKKKQILYLFIHSLVGSTYMYHYSCFQKKANFFRNVFANPPKLHQRYHFHLTTSSARPPDRGRIKPAAAALPARVAISTLIYVHPHRICQNSHKSGSTGLITLLLNRKFATKCHNKLPPEDNCWLQDATYKTKAFAQNLMSTLYSSQVALSANCKKKTTFRQLEQTTMNPSRVWMKRAQHKRQMYLRVVL